MNVRFVEGSRDDYDVIYDADWPVVPRVGEFVEIESGTIRRYWEVKRVCHVADAMEKYTGSLVWIRQASHRDALPTVV